MPQHLSHLKNFELLLQITVLREVAGVVVYTLAVCVVQLKHKVRCEAMKNIGEGICRIADEEGADLIVVGTQGTGGIRFSSKGSVCEYVMRNSPVPTVVVPSRKHHF